MLHLLTILSFFFSLASALTIPLAARDVVVPPVTEPTSNSVWKVGSKQTIKWDTSNFPPKENITNIHGTLILGFLTDDSENLMTDTPLAKGFSLLDGHVEITVPSVEPRNDYIVALIGNSGNISPKFTIGKAGTVAAASAASSSSTSDSISWGIPITGTTITGGSATTTSTIADPSLSVSTTGTPTGSDSTSPSATAPPSGTASGSGESSGASSPSDTPSGSALSLRGGNVMLLWLSTLLGAVILL